MSRAKLKQGARKTSQGKARAALPGVKTDAKHAQARDKRGYGANRELAEMIGKAVRAKKKADKHGAHFVLGWRLYPNKDHPRWSKDTLPSARGRLALLARGSTPPHDSATKRGGNQNNNHPHRRAQVHKVLLTLGLG